MEMGAKDDASGGGHRKREEVGGEAMAGNGTARADGMRGDGAFCSVVFVSLVVSGLCHAPPPSWLCPAVPGHKAGFISGLGVYT